MFQNQSHNSYCYRQKMNYFQWMITPLIPKDLLKVDS